MPKKSIFTRHSLYAAVLENLQPLAARVHNGQVGEPLLTALDYRSLEILARLENLIHVVERVTAARYLLERSPRPYRVRRAPFDHDQWTEYHFFVYTTSMASILDCALLLTSSVFDLGIPDRFCTFDVVTQHRVVADTSIPKLLDSLRKSLLQHTARRHRYLHRGQGSDIQELTKPSSFQYVEPITLFSIAYRHKFPSEMFDVPNDLRVLWGKIELVKLRPLLERSERDVFRKITGVFNGLNRVLERQVQIAGGTSGDAA